MFFLLPYSLPLVLFLKHVLKILIRCFPVRIQMISSSWNKMQVFTGHWEDAILTPDLRNEVGIARDIHGPYPACHHFHTYFFNQLEKVYLRGEIKILRKHWRRILRSEHGTMHWAHWRSYHGWTTVRVIAFIDSRCSRSVMSTKTHVAIGN